MLAHIAIPLIVALAGLLLHLLTDKKLSQIGWVLFCVGVLWAVAIASKAGI